MFHLNKNIPFGMEHKLMLTLADYFNFTIQYVSCDGIYGITSDNVTWTGMMQMLLDQVCKSKFYYN